MIQLSHLNLADNLMGKIPFVPLSHVKSLKSLDMSNNRIIKIEGIKHLKQQDFTELITLRFTCLIVL